MTIAIPKNVARALELQILGDPVERLKGRSVRVTGTAKRVTIRFFSKGVRTDSYYFRTHVTVSDISQLILLSNTLPKNAGADLPSFGHFERNPRGIQYVDFVPSPSEIKEQLEMDGWKNVKVIKTFPDYLQGPIRTLALFHWPSNSFPVGPPQGYGRITSDRIEYLNLEFGADGIVTATLELPDGRRAITFHVAVKQHYVMIIWDPSQRTGYVWRSFIYNRDGTPTEMRFLIQRHDLERI